MSCKWGCGPHVGSWLSGFKYKIWHPGHLMLMVCVTVSGNNRQLSKNSARRALPQLQTPTLMQFTRKGYIKRRRTLIARVASAHRDTSESFKARSGVLPPPSSSTSSRRQSDGVDCIANSDEQLTSNSAFRYTSRILKQVLMRSPVRKTVGE